MTNPENNPDAAVQPVKRGRGRPKGAKNKPKPLVPVNSDPSVQPEGSFSLPKRRGRPKGSKNKPKIIAPVIGQVDEVVAKHPITIPASSIELELSTEEHPLLTAAKWLERKMPVVELLYYKNRATKQNSTLTHTIASAIVGLFNVQDPELRKQLKA
jgi:hypothetical protein